MSSIYMLFGKKCLLSVVSCLILLSIFMPLLVFGQATSGGSNPPPTTGGLTGVGIINPVGATTLHGLINSIVTALLNFGAVVAVVAMIYSGFLFVKARGNEEKLGEAKRTFMYTVIGIAVLLGARVISEIIENTITQLK